MQIPTWLLYEYALCRCMRLKMGASTSNSTCLQRAAVGDQRAAMGQ